MAEPATELDRERTLSLEEIEDAWPVLAQSERIEAFRLLPGTLAEELFESLDAGDQADLVLGLPAAEGRLWIRLLEPDDAADVIQAAPEEGRDHLLALLDEPTRKEVAALLAYAEDDAGGLMSPRYARLRPDMRVDEAIAYLRVQARERLETIYYVYVLDTQQHLLGVVSFRELFAAAPERTVRDVMSAAVVTAREDMDQEALSQLFAEHGFMAIPVVDDENRMRGIVTIDDIVDVVREEATEDIQKFGGVAALDEPYLRIGLGGMIRKRAGWLTALFLGQMLTATAMGHFEGELERALVLAIFLPLIISSGGNSGSQASTLVVRAMALAELRLRDWWRVARREASVGLTLGVILGVLGVLRIVYWPGASEWYGDHLLLLGVTLGLSLVGVVLWGTIVGSMLPFVLRGLGFDPASASAPFVATLVDVTGIVIYFTVASVVLRGTLL
jgi:magnesium transporter